MVEIGEISLSLAEIKVYDGESIEAALRRFKKEVIRSGIILEIKKRKHHENKRQKKKRKRAEAKRRVTFQANMNGANLNNQNTNNNKKTRGPSQFKSER